jgi:hypothetical protein
MNREDHLHLLAERAELQRILAGIPESDVLTRNSFAARLEEVEEQLASVPSDLREPARARLTFRGRPVVGTHGIVLEFGTAATRAFADLLAKVAAALGGSTSVTASVPEREANQLLITSTAIGSFGFELEEHCAGHPPSGDDSPTAQALEFTLTLLKSTLGTDDELTDAVAAADPGVLASLRAFLQMLVDNEAVCTLEYRGRWVRYTDVGQIRQTLARLEQDNVHEQQTELDGEFQGVLPKSRCFEFKLASSGKVVSGKVGPAIADPTAINKCLHRRTRIAVMATKVGNGRPRYVLIAPPDCSNEAQSTNLNQVAAA